MRADEFRKKSPPSFLSKRIFVSLFSKGFNGGTGDQICFISAAREYARRNSAAVFIASHHTDIIDAYGDSFVKHVSKIEEPYETIPVSLRDLYISHRQKTNSETAVHCKNYLGTYFQALGIDVETPPKIELPSLSRIVKGNSPYAVIQPKSVFAANYPYWFVQQAVYAVRSQGLTVCAVGKTSTERHLNSVDWSYLSDRATDAMALIQHAAVVLTPRSMSAHIAAGYGKRTVCWVPDDGENWHLNYPDWPVKLVKNADEAIEGLDVH